MQYLVYGSQETPVARVHGAVLRPPALAPLERRSGPRVHHARTRS